MYVASHPVEQMLRGDGDGRNPRNIAVYPLQGGGELIVGRFVDDGVRRGAPMNAPRRQDVHFEIYLPPGFQAWHALNTQIYYALKSGQSPVVIDVRFR